MRKIPTLFVRDPEDRAHVLRDVTPGCEWVIAGEGVATRKYDGTCVLIERDGLAVHAFARRAVKPGKPRPEGFQEVGHDDTTGVTIGWEPAEQSGYAKWIAEAVTNAAEDRIELLPGTYELCGPKVQQNADLFAMHELVPHGQRVLDWVPRDFDRLRALLTDINEWPEWWEGIVWHHPDGRMAKLKRRDMATEDHR